MYIVKQLKNDSTSDISKFIKLEYKLYKGDLNWTAHLFIDTKAVLYGKKNPLFKNGEHVFFMVFDEKNEPVGRILAGIDAQLNAVKGFRQGYFSMFECINDYKAAVLLFDAAVGWLKQRGMNTVIGPLSPSNSDDRKGFLVKGEGPPVLLNAYTKDYYAALVEKYGFSKNDDHLAYLFDPAEFNLKRHEKVVAFAKRRAHYTVDRLNKKDLWAESKDFKEIIDNSIPEDWDYLVAPTREGIMDEFKNLKQFYDGHFCYVARAGTRPIGFLTALPDYFQVLHRMNGKILPFGWYKFLRYRKKIDCVRAFTQMVVHDYQKKGVNHAMYLELYRDAVKMGIKSVEASCVDEKNYESRLSIEKSGGNQYRTYRTYRYNF